MKLTQALHEYLLEIEIRKYTAKTIRSYRNNLALFVRYLEEEAAISDTEDLTLASVRRFSLYMGTKGKKGTYINSLLKTAKSFIQYCYDEGYHSCIDNSSKISLYRHFSWYMYSE